MNILEGCKVEGQCLNLRNEWGGAKVPDLEVKTPKGVAKARKEVGNLESESGQEGEEKAVGLRRIRQDQEDQQMEVKRRRSREPDREEIGEATTKPKNFLEVMMARRYQNTSTQKGNSTSVRKKIMRIEEKIQRATPQPNKRKRCLRGQGRQPSP